SPPTWTAACRARSTAAAHTASGLPWLRTESTASAMRMEPIVPQSLGRYPSVRQDGTVPRKTSGRDRPAGRCSTSRPPPPPPHPPDPTPRDPRPRAGPAPPPRPIPAAAFEQPPYHRSQSAIGGPPEKRGIVGGSNQLARSVTRKVITASTAKGAGESGLSHL